jgi:hypothetical protein
VRVESVLVRACVRDHAVCAAYENNRPQAILVCLKAMVPILLCVGSHKYGNEIMRLMLDLHCNWPRQVCEASLCQCCA